MEYKKVNTEIGDVGRNLRLLIGYSPSITQVCREIQISRQQFSKYLSGRSAPRLRSIQRICDYFGLEEWELILPHPEFRKLIAIRPPENISPTRRFPAYTLSRRAPSTTRPRLLKLAVIYLYQVCKRDNLLCSLNQQNEYLHACFVCLSFRFFQSALTQSLM